MSKQPTRTIKVDTLARVEGEGALYVKLKGDQVQDVKLKIYEPPRFFEAFLRGRHFSEVPDIVARICGICPIAYQMSAVHAIEHALGVEIDPSVRLLRRLFYCGEWIESHALHVYMLHAPDFLGYPDAIAMARDHQAIVAAGPAPEKGRQPHRGLDGRPGNSSGFRRRRRLLQSTLQERTQRTGGRTQMGSRRLAGHSPLGFRVRLS